MSGQLAALGRRVGSRGSSIALSDVVDGLGRAGIGLTLLLLTLPALIPVPGPVGMVFGSLVAFVSAQLMFGARRLWLPGLVRRWHVSTAVVQAICSRAAPLLARIEGRLRPRRLLPLTGRLGRMALGAPLLLMGIAIALPVPLGNVPPAASLIALSLGLMVRDGAAILVGLALAALAALWFVVLFFFGAQLLEWLLAAAGW